VPIPVLESAIVIGAAIAILLIPPLKA